MAFIVFCLSFVRHIFRNFPLIFFDVVVSESFVASKIFFEKLNFGNLTKFLPTLYSFTKSNRMRKWNFRGKPALNLENALFFLWVI